MWDKIKGFFSLKDEFHIHDEVMVEVPLRGENIIPIHKKSGSSGGHAEISTELAVVHPQTFSDSLLVMRLLQNRSSALVNVTRMSEEEAQRFIDFVSGSAYALDGYQEKVGEGVFLITPSNVFINSNRPLATPYGGGIIGRG